MAIELSFNDIQQEILSFQSGFERQLDLEPSEACLPLPPSLGTGYLRVSKVREGLEVEVQDFVPKYDTLIYGENSPIQDAHITLTFCLAGQFNGGLSDVYSHVPVRVNNTVFCSMPHSSGTVEYKAGEHVRFIRFTLNPALIIDLIAPEFAELPQKIQKTIQSGASQPAMYFCDTSYEMAQILNNIIYSPYFGKIRSVYLESKVLELMALYFGQFYLSSNLATSTLVKRENITHVYECREILRQNLINPPSLEELANLVGISEHKLQQGFRELFGTTVFGVLHHDRMEYARQLLETQQMTIGAVSKKVGIAHGGYFAKAFKKRFGKTPRDYIKRFN